MRLWSRIGGVVLIGLASIVFVVEARAAQPLAGPEAWFTCLGAECERLGLGLTVQKCPGWSQSGGPWIDLDHCQRDLRMARVDLAFGERFRLPDVPNTWRNRIIYDLGQPERNRKTWILYKEGFNPRTDDPFGPSGILGSVMLKW